MAGAGARARWRGLRLGALAVAILAACLALAAWRLAQSPVAAPWLAAAAERALTDARDGRPVRVKSLEFVWTEGVLRARARGVEALSTEGAVLSRSERVDLGVSIWKLLMGRLALEEAVFVGGDITVRTRPDGFTEVAFGRPGAPADFLIPPGPAVEDWRAEAQRALDTLDTLASLFAANGAAGQLRRLEMTGAHLYVAGNGEAAPWIAEDAAIALRRRGQTLSLRVSATLRRDDAMAELAGVIRTDARFDQASFDVRLDDALLRALGRRSARLSALDAPAKAHLEGAIDRAKGLTRLYLDVSGGRGALWLAGERLQIESFKLRGRLSPGGESLDVDAATVSGADIEISGGGRIERLSALLGGGGQGVAPFSINAPVVRVVTSAFSEPLLLSEVAVDGAVDPSRSRIEVSRASLGLGSARADLTGAFYWRRDEVGALKLGAEGSGGLSGEIDAPTLLRFWPVELGKGARDWLVEALLSARISDVTLDLNLTPEALALERLPDEALEVTFALREGALRYIPEMTPLSGAVARGVLRGDSFRIDVTSGRIGPLVVAAGAVDIPKLSREGDARVVAHGQGRLRDVVELLLLSPLDLAEGFPFDVTTLTGAGALDLVITRPLRSGVQAEDVGFEVSGAFEEVGAVSRSGRVTLTDWALTVAGNQDALTFSGPLRFGGSQAELVWTERFGDGPEAGSVYALDGALNAADLDLLGIPVRSFAQGRVGVQLKGRGEGLAFDAVEADLDLQDADVALPRSIWVKRAGAPARASMLAQRDAAGVVRLSDVMLQAPGLDVRLDAAIAADGRLLRLDASRAWIEDRFDARVRAVRDAAGVLRLNVTGRQFDASVFLPDGDPEQDTAAPVAGGAAGPDFFARVAVQRLGLRGGESLRDGRVELALRGDALDSLRVSGRGAAGAPLTLDIVEAPGEALRRVRLDAADAGLAQRALLDADNIQGGEAHGEGVWDPRTERLELDLTLSDFRLNDVPVMARLLSSVASLQGAADLLNGEGLAFSTVRAPLSLDDGVLVLKEARASGPSIGLSATGRIDLAREDMAIEGVLVPAYRLNAALGEVPGLGRLFTSRKGEGVFGFTYTVRGPTDRARVIVNPASGLAPGILRRMFESGDARAESRAAEEGQVQAE